MLGTATFLEIAISCSETENSCVVATVFFMPRGCWVVPFTQYCYNECVLFTQHSFTWKPMSGSNHYMKCSLRRTVSFLANAKYENLVQKLFHIFLGNSQVISEQFQWWIRLNCGFLETTSQVHSPKLSFGQR